MSRRKFPVSDRPWLFAALVAFWGLVLMAPRPGQAEVVRIGGTGSGLATMAALATSYQSQNPAFQFEVVPNLGSSGGIKAIVSRKITIALSNRAPKPSEFIPGLHSFEYAKTPFVFVTNKAGVKNIQLHEIAAIYSGRQLHWQDGSPIRLVLRDLGDSDNSVIAAMSPDLKEAVVTAHQRKGLRVALSDQESADALEELPGSFGASTKAVVSSEKRRLTPLSVNGVEPTLANLKTGRYPYFKEMHLIHFGDSASDDVKKFLNFIRSSRGQDLLRQLGNEPVSAGR